MRLFNLAAALCLVGARLGAQEPAGWNRSDSSSQGSVVEQVKGGKAVTPTAGQTFYEGPDDIHVVGKHASSTKTAKILAILVKNKDAPPLVPVK